jgi:membrane fusion protein, multidrug efflux system
MFHTNRCDVGSAARYYGGGAGRETRHYRSNPSSQPTPAKVSRVPHGWPMRWVLIALLPLVLIGGTYRYAVGGQVMATDAHVNAETAGISTNVSGVINYIDVTEHQHVDAGRVPYRLDLRVFQIVPDNARANLAQTTRPTVPRCEAAYR